MSVLVRGFRAKGRSGQDTFRAPTPRHETPAKTPAETPAANARAGREPQNPRTREDPPTPLQGELSRRLDPDRADLRHRARAARRRTVRVDLDEVRRRLETRRRPIGATGADPRAARGDGRREHVRDLAEPVELIAVDGDQKLVLAAPSATAGWVSNRFGRVIAACASRVGREVRFAEEPERHAVGPDAPSRSRFQPTTWRPQDERCHDQQPEGRRREDDRWVSTCSPAAPALAGIEMSPVGELGRERFLRDALESVCVACPNSVRSRRSVTTSASG